MLRRLVDVREGELAPLAWSLLYFFALLCSYYMMRPLRDAMGLAGGVRQLPWLMTATFVATLAAVPPFAALVARFTRARVLPVAYRFCLACILGFFLLIRAEVEPLWVARAFYVWVSVFNLLVVSVFWSFMTDLWRTEQGKRLFGLVSAGGSAGALLGPLLTRLLVVELGAANLLLVAAALLELATLCLSRLARRARAAAPASDRPVGGGVLAAATAIAGSPTLAALAAQTLLFTTASTFLYLAQGAIVEAAVSGRDARAEYYAGLDLITQIASLALQALAFHRLTRRRAGLAAALAAVPGLGVGGFALLAAAPTLLVSGAFQVARRALHYALERPGREVLFTQVSREARYKSQVFMDTVVYRGGDMASGWLWAALGGLGLALPGLCLAAVPVALGGAALGVFLAREHARIAARAVATGATER